MIDTLAEEGPPRLPDRKQSQEKEGVAAPSTKKAAPPATCTPEELASMLRKCADFVEKDQFDSVMYQTLQDFRVYYKSKVPKKKSPDGNDGDKPKRRKKKITTTTSTFIPADAAKGKANNSSADDLDIDAKGATKPQEAKRPALEKDLSSKSNSKSASTIGTEATSGTASQTDIDAKAGPKKSDIFAKPRSHIRLGGGMKESSNSHLNNTTTTAAKPVPARVSPIAVPIAAKEEAASASGNTHNHHHHGSAKAAAAAVFSKIKIPKIHIPNPSFVSTSKKNATRAKSDLDEAAAATKNSSGLAAQTEASARRRTESSDDVHVSPREWCEEHFTMGCYCKVRNNGGSTRTVTDESVITTQSNQNKMPVNFGDDNGFVRTSSAASSNDVAKDEGANSSNMQKKLGFRRPTNSDSSLVATGWLEQHRRSKMRVVWKEVLATLVEGKTPGQETTLWIQREAGLHSATGSQSLEPLHQIPMKWLQDVAYIGHSIDHRFTVKVFNLTEEFTFRCPTSEDAQNWVVTLRSARDAALHGKINRPPTASADSFENLFPADASSTFEEEKKGNDSVQSNGHSSHQRARQDPTAQPTATASAPKPRLKVSDLRAICHGAGVNTAGMERSELEKAAAEVEARGTYFDVPVATARAPVFPSATAPATNVANTAAQNEKRRQDEVRKRNEEEELRRQAQIRQQQEERHRAEEQDRLRKMSEQQASEQRKRQDEQLRQRQQQQWQQQQAAWQRQQQEEEQRRRAEEARVAEHRRQQEEAYRRQQQWYHQQQQQQQQQWPGHQAQQPPQQQWPGHQQHPQHQQQQWPGHQQQPPQQSGWNQQQQQQPFHQQQQQQQPQENGSAASQKYAKMANQNDDSGQAATTRIKHDILIQWALQPPMLQMLRPIEVLVATIHKVFPPALNVKAHAYFDKWTPIQQQDVMDGNKADDAKLKKTVRKIRFFLHPDKLPKDLDAEQQYVVKMLWDITSDAWEEFHKKAEELDWAN